MSNVNKVMDKLGLREVKSVNQAIVMVSDYLFDKSPEHANQLIVELGGEPELSHPVAADIMIKAMVEQIISGQFTDAVAAQAYGHEKIAKIKAKMPFVFTTITQEVDEQGELVQKRSKGASNDKNAKSLAFVKAMVAKGELDRGVITTALAEELGTDYAGAYFYCKKSEKELKVELTSVRGRKAVKKATV